MGEVNDKALMWLHYGVRLVWVVRPNTRTVDVYRAGQRVSSLSDEENIGWLGRFAGFHSCRK